MEKLETKKKINFSPDDDGRGMIKNVKKQQILNLKGLFLLSVRRLFDYA